MNVQVRGVHAALFTPRRPDGALNLEVLRSHAGFLLNSGMDGLVINGATGEYLHSREDDFPVLLDTVSSIAGNGRFMVGIGGTDVQRSIENGRLAIDAGAKALLLPAPHFFRYSQDDLIAYVQQIANGVGGPILLYNLPQFTNNTYEPATVLNLVSANGPVIGIKDSSGSLESLRVLTKRDPNGASRIVGNDQVLVQGRQEGVSDGVISGVAAAMPELIRYLTYTSLDDPNYPLAASLLNELIEQLGPFPVPWGLKLIAERRGLGSMGFVIPFASARTAQVDTLTAWLEEWWPRATDILQLQPLEAAGQAV